MTPIDASGIFTLARQGCSPQHYRTMHPHRLSLIGTGLLGGSIGLAVKRFINGCEVVGYGPRSGSLRLAKENGAIDEISSDLETAVSGADLVILCSPVGTFAEILNSIRGHLANKAVVTDVGSTKRSVCRDAESILPPTVRFVGSHPMAGSERRGIEAASAELLRDALCITTPTPNTDPAALAWVEQFWRTLGMRTTRLSPDDHDRILAEVSHLPHAIAAALVAVQSADALKIAGKGFADTTRIAGGDGGLWRDILLDNADNVRAAIARFRAELDRLESFLSPRQNESLKNYLDAAAQRRGQLPGKS